MDRAAGRGVSWRQALDEGGAGVRHNAGELDVITAADARHALNAAVDQHHSVVVDLGQVTFCDCTGLIALLAAARTARARGVELQLRAVPHSLARILRLTGTHRAFRWGAHTGHAQTLRPTAAIVRVSEIRPPCDA
ncbi:STAS domain-containing protein [Streptomyces sp. NPDC006356]